MEPQQSPEQYPQEIYPTRPRRESTTKRWALIGASVLAIAALITAAVLLLRPSGTMLERAVSSCGLSNNKHVELDADGLGLYIATSDLSDRQQGIGVLDDLGCVHRSIGSPEAMLRKMLTTTTADGTMTYQWEDMAVAWVYKENGTFDIFFVE